MTKVKLTPNLRAAVKALNGGSVKWWVESGAGRPTSWLAAEWELHFCHCRCHYILQQSGTATETPWMCGTAGPARWYSDRQLPVLLLLHRCRNKYLIMKRAVFHSGCSDAIISVLGMPSLFFRKIIENKIKTRCVLHILTRRWLATFDLTK